MRMESMNCDAIECENLLLLLLVCPFGAGSVYPYRRTVHPVLRILCAVCTQRYCAL